MKRIAVLILGMVSWWIAPLAAAQSLSFDELVGEEPSKADAQQQAEQGGGDLYQRIGRAVGVVVLVTRDNRRIPMGTAWGLAPGVFATNAHVAAAVLKYGAKGIRSQVQMNNSVSEIYTIKSAKIHPAYDSSQSSYDVATLQVTSTKNPTLPIAKEKRLKGMRAGMEVAYVGFPMESLNQDNINIQRPIASVQKGSIVAISDYNMKDAGYRNNHMIRHSIPATGGASGSPIFDESGTVIALLNAGNIIVLKETKVEDGRLVIKSERSPSAAMINFGVRVDLLRDLL